MFDLFLTFDLLTDKARLGSQWDLCLPPERVWWRSRWAHSQWEDQGNTSILMPSIHFAFYYFSLNKILIVWNLINQIQFYSILLCTVTVRLHPGTYVTVFGLLWLSVILCTNTVDLTSYNEYSFVCPGKHSLCCGRNWQGASGEWKQGAGP